MKRKENGIGEERMKTVKGAGLLAGVFTLLHGLYLILHFTWVFTLIVLGLGHACLAAQVFYLHPSSTYRRGLNC
jgi:1,4-dihydroxy-2-naphthoate octaprenyltransferase